MNYLIKLLLLTSWLTFTSIELAAAANQNMPTNPVQVEAASTDIANLPDTSSTLGIEASTNNANNISNDEIKSGWTDKVQEVLINALSLSGIKYRAGGNSPTTGFDCSGFVRYVFQQGISLTLPPTARAIGQLGKSISKDALQPGDLVFFNTLKSTFSHVGIYIGNNRFIHSPSPGGVVRIEDLQSTYWNNHYNGAKRIDAVSGEVKK